MTRSPHPPTGTLKDRLQSLTGFSHIFCPDDFKNTSVSQGCIVVTSPAVGAVGIMQGQGKGLESLINCLSPAPRSTAGHILSMISSNIAKLKGQMY